MISVVPQPGVVFHVVSWAHCCRIPHRYEASGRDFASLTNAVFPHGPHIPPSENKHLCVSKLIH